MAQFTSTEFPHSFNEPFEITSPASGEYNCIAWALLDLTHFIWPLRQRGFYWPKGLPMKETRSAFVDLFAKHGYKICDNGNLEKGFLKLALFEKDGIPTHAARQLPYGKWTSKIGAHFDVSHSLKAMAGGRYGEVALFFKKPV